MKDGVSEGPENCELTIDENNDTKNGIISYQDLIRDDGNLDIKAKKRIILLNTKNFEPGEKGTKTFQDSDIVNYFYRRYYTEGCGLRNIANELGVHVKTISNWFSRYLGWRTREFIGPKTLHSRKTRSTSMKKRINGDHFQEYTQNKVDEIFKNRSSLVLSSETHFDYTKFSDYEHTYHKIHMIFDFSGYPDGYLEKLILKLHEENNRSSLIFHIVNTLVKQLIIMGGLNIKIESISRSTIRDIIQRGGKGLIIK